MKQNLEDNDLFIKRNFEKLIKRYAHQIIVICRGEIFKGDDAVKRARKKYPNATPLWFHVPGPENFLHVL